MLESKRIGNYNNSENLVEIVTNYNLPSKLLNALHKRKQVLYP